MEYGLIPKINQYADNNELLIQQIQPSNATAKVATNDEAQQIARDNLLKELGESSSTGGTEASSSTSKTNAPSSSTSQFNEVVLTNLNFGFNNSSRDFYVKAVRGEAESQYPTDEMMRLKAYYLEQAQQSA